MFRRIVGMVVVCMGVATVYGGNKINYWSVQNNSPVPVIKFGNAAITPTIGVDQNKVPVVTFRNGLKTVIVTIDETYDQIGKTSNYAASVSMKDWRTLFGWDKAFDGLVDHMDMQLEWRYGEAEPLCANISGDYKGEMQFGSYQLEVQISQEYAVTWNKCADGRIVMQPNDGRPERRRFRLEYKADVGGSTHAETKYDKLRESEIMTGGLNRLYFIGKEEILKVVGEGLENTDGLNALVISSAKIQKADTGNQNKLELVIDKNIQAKDAAQVVSAATLSDAFLAVFNTLTNGIGLSWKATQELFADDNRKVDGSILKTAPFSTAIACDTRVYLLTTAGNWGIKSNCMASLQWNTGGANDNGGHPNDGYVLQGNGFARTNILKLTKVDPLLP